MFFYIKCYTCNELSHKTINYIKFKNLNKISISSIKDLKKEKRLTKKSLHRRDLKS